MRFTAVNIFLPTSKILHTIVVIVWVVLSGFGQEQIVDQASLKSLFTELNETKDPTKKMEISLEIAIKHISYNPDTVIKYAEDALLLAQQTGDVRTQVSAMGFIGEANIYKGNLPKTLQLGLEAIDLHKSLKLTRDNAGPTIGPTYFNLIELYIQLKDYNKAFEYSKKKIALGKFEDGDGEAKTTSAFAYYLTAKTFEQNNQLDSAALYIQKAFEAFDNVKELLFGDVYEAYPKCYNVEAAILFKQNQAQKALESLRKGLAISEASGESLHSSEFNNDLSKYYLSEGKTDSAIYYANRGLEEAKKIRYAQAMLISNNILAEIYDSIDAAKALEYYKRANNAKNELYGSGNIEVMKDMIAEYEKRSLAIEQAERNYRNKSYLLMLLAALSILALILYFQYQGNKKSKEANIILSNTLNELKATQAQLIQSEKMASLGELTAGIAHEIQNPLNFVNNFAEVSTELIDEINEELENGDIAEVKEILSDLKGNLSKINHHGKRADGIVKGMLQHSRKSTGQKEPTDINALCDEYLRLSYHGLRAKDKSFNATLETDFDKSIGLVKVIPQDMGRVLLNIITNAFHTVQEKKTKLSGQIEEYNPTVSVKTMKHQEEVIIRISDNGDGIPKEIKDKIFQPFFTTKPTGKGTGLGLSLAYDIVSSHNGELKVESEEGEGTTFEIHFPINHITAS